jgi:diguanylate cyclase (GGDEF)-like protein
VNPTPVCLHADLAGDHALPAGALAAYVRRTATSLRAALAAVAETRPALLVLRPLSTTGALELASFDRALANAPPLPCLLVVSAEACAALRAAPPQRAALAWTTSDAPAAEYDLLAERLRREAELLRELEEVRHRALHDDLTGLLRPLAFEERLRAHYSAAQRHRFPLALLLLDLDKFGAINKQFDHTVGDRIVREAAAALRGALRTEDVAGRLGGDEFGVCLPYTTSDAARLVGERVRAAIEQLSRADEDGRGALRVASSIGFECFDGRNLAALQVLRLHAERALRTAKQSGGNQVRYYRELPEAPR